MRKTIDLLIYELNRIKFAYLGMVMVIFLLQLAEIFRTHYNRLTRFNLFQRDTQGNIIDFVNEFGKVSFNSITGGGLYHMSIMIGIICLIAYAIIIWYRDWLGKNNLSYRLLTLPGSRMSIFTSKLLAILFMLFSLLALQLLFILAGRELLNVLTPQEMYQETLMREAIRSNSMLNIIYPRYFFDFLIHYTVGITALLVGYTIILMERSFKWKGILAAIAVVLLAITAFVLFMQSPAIYYFFSMELLLLFLVCCVAIIFGSFLYSRYLIEKKITI